MIGCHAEGCANDVCILVNMGARLKNEVQARCELAKEFIRQQ
jgi:hypothetical protein